MENKKSYFCNNCQKTYKNYRSLWNHNKKYHKIINDTDINDALQITPNTSSSPPNHSKITPFVYKCKFCNKNFSRIDNLHRHENSRCKNNNDIIKQNSDLKEELVILKSELSELKKILLNKMNKQCKTHPKTLQKINNMLANTASANNTLANVTTNQGVINNNTGPINNNYIIALGKEDLSSILSEKEQINILNKKNNCLEHMIKQIHFNDKFPQFKNILITNIINNVGYIYDEKEQKFVATTKDDLLDRLIIHRMGDIEEFYELHLDKLDDQTKKSIEKFIDKMEDEPTFTKNRKKNIKLIIYNNRDKVSNELVHNLEIYI
jgi:DNA-directed RNA polymerase subunit RPC12/RpoP